MARVRSPNYPQFGLNDAIRRAAQVFEKERQHQMPKDVLAKHLGYGGLNGASLGAISALLKYGLVEQQGESYRVADRALAILHPRSEAEKAEALRAAALSPALFAELAEQFKGGPPSDDNLRAYLVRKGFAQSALSGAIQAFRETIDLIPTATPEGEGKSMGNAASADIRGGGLPPPPPATHENALRVAVNGEKLEVSASLLDQKGVERLIKVLQANKELLPDMLPSTTADKTTN